MDQRRKIFVRYSDGYEFTGSIKIPLYKVKTITTSHTKRYHNCLCRLAGIQGCARNLLDYLTEIMNGNNYISSNKNVRAEFISLISKAKNDKGGFLIYSDETVKKAFGVLRDKNFLLQTKYRGAYQVNPLYFWKNNDMEREIVIRVALEFNPNIEITEIEVKK